MYHDVLILCKRLNCEDGVIHSFSQRDLAKAAVYVHTLGLGNSYYLPDKLFDILGGLISHRQILFMILIVSVAEHHIFKSAL